MKNKVTKIITDQLSYKNRIMAGIVFAELFAISVFLFWPVPDQEQTYQDIVFSDSEPIIDEMLITTQKSSPPPPPKPQVPVPVPNDEIIEEDIPILEDIDISEYTDSMSIAGIGKAGDSDQVASNPQIPPSVIRIVEPTVPNAAKKADIKAEILVSFLVNKEGQVEEATISEIKLYDKKSDTFETVDYIAYGLTDATLEAAFQWKFRPAKNGDSVVKSFTKHIFTYGF